MPSVCEADESRGRNGKSPSAGRPVSGPYERTGRFCIYRRGGCPHPPALEGAPFLGHGLPDAPFRLPAKRRRGGTLGRPPYPTAQLGPHRNKGAFKKGSARRGKSSQLSHPRLCVNRKARLIGAPVKMGSGVSGPMGTKCPSAASPAILWVLSHRWERTSPPQRRNPPQQATNFITAPSSVWLDGQPPSPQGEGLERGAAKSPCS